MKLLKIQESGSNNILKWAISNGADIKSDPALQSVIDDSLQYIVAISDINFFELFRLTQIYRNKLHIIDQEQAEMPSIDKLNKLFNGVYHNEEDNSDIPLSELVSYCGEKFMSLVMQMSNDDDIIHSNATKMFLPMISRKYTIQLPIRFTDFINSMSDDESKEIYNSNYPNTIDTIIESEMHGVKTTLQLAVMRATSIIKYNKQYDKYINLIKYSALKTCDKNKLFKFAMLGFTKKDYVTNNEIRLDMFNVSANESVDIMKRMANMNGDLEVEFVIQLPIHYMQMLENHFGDDILPMAYESSMSNIIDGGLVYENFITADYDDNDRVVKHNNEINNYRIRINEVNQIMLNTMPILLNSNGDIDKSSIFALMPSIYSTKAVIKMNIKNAEALVNHYDPMIKELFNEMASMRRDVIVEISHLK